jgi:hypothetical protein
MAARNSREAQAPVLLGPLVGIYDLRHADAHLASSDIESALGLVKVDQKATFVIQGYQQQMLRFMAADAAKLATGN